MAELLINNRDVDIESQAIDAALEALEYATQPWYDLPRLGKQVRSHAARILGQLDPLYHDERIFARLTHVLYEDDDPAVRDSAYEALLRLASAPRKEAVK